MIFINVLYPLIVYFTEIFFIWALIKLLLYKLMINLGLDNTVLSFFGEYLVQDFIIGKEWCLLESQLSVLKLLVFLWARKVIYFDILFYKFCLVSIIIIWVIFASSNSLILQQTKTLIIKKNHIGWWTYIEVGIEFTVELLVEKIKQTLVLITCKMDDPLLLFVVDVQKAYLIAKSREFNGLL